MKMIDTVAAQGEIYIRRIGDKAPRGWMKGGKPAEMIGNRIIIGHSETGHHHVIERGGIDVMEMPVREGVGIRILRMIVEDVKHLVHERPTDTHETIALRPGAYEAILGREYDPYAQVARQQAD